MADTSRISTDELLALLFKERNLEHFLQRNESAYLTASFSDYMNTWCKQHLEVPEQVIRRANPMGTSWSAASATRPGTRFYSWPLPWKPI